MCDDRVILVWLLWSQLMFALMTVFLLYERRQRRRSRRRYSRAKVYAI